LLGNVGVCFSKLYDWLLKTLQSTKQNYTFKRFHLQRGTHLKYATSHHGFCVNIKINKTSSYFQHMRLSTRINQYISINVRIDLIQHFKNKIKWKKNDELILKGKVNQRFSKYIKWLCPTHINKLYQRSNLTWNHSICQLEDNLSKCTYFEYNQQNYDRSHYHLYLLSTSELPWETAIYHAYVTIRYHL
jgi:hypothetical protein